MFVRLARYEVPPERVSEAAEAFAEAGRAIEQLEGFRGGYVLVDHESGAISSFTLWANRAALDATETSARMQRQRAAQAVDGEVLSVERLEVLTELRAPGG